MLIEFSVANYRSFREKQTLSMVAAPRIRKRGNTFVAPVDGEALPELLKVAVIYGPNAAGKSNLLRALWTIASIAKRADQDVLSRLLTPFKFDKKLIDQPSHFSLAFIADRQRYEFIVEATAERITRECLVAFPRGQQTLVYERIHSESVDRYEFGTLEGGETVRNAWQKLTPPHALFISQAVANSSEDLQQLRIPYAWLTGAILNLATGRVREWAEGSLELTRDVEGSGDYLASFLSDVDVPISRIRVEKSTASEVDAELEALANGSENQLRSKRRSSARSSAVFTHTTALGEAELKFGEESEGTQNLVGFWLPWSTREPRAGTGRCVLAIDELDSSLHPSVVASLVRKHIEVEIPSQLIFTTHNTHLMDSRLLRRDQIWITERDKNGATQLRSVHDFQGREGEDIEKRYFEGRYRGLPLIRE